MGMMNEAKLKEDKSFEYKEQKSQEIKSYKDKYK